MHDMDYVNKSLSLVLVLAHFLRTRVSVLPVAQ